MHLTERQIKRFHALVKRGKPNKCWLWKGQWDGTYGKMGVNYREIKAHRIAYFLATGDDPKEMDVCHSCDTPLCCNPAHLWKGTRSANLRDASWKGRLGGNGRAGTDNPRCKLTEGQVIAIKLTNGMAQREIAERYGIARSLVSRIRAGQSWTHIQI